MYVCVCEGRADGETFARLLLVYQLAPSQLQGPASLTNAIAAGCPPQEGEERARGRHGSQVICMPHTTHMQATRGRAPTHTNMSRMAMAWLRLITAASVITSEP